MLAVPREQLYLMLKSLPHKRHIDVRGAHEHVSLRTGPILMCPQSKQDGWTDVKLTQKVSYE